MPRLDAPTWFDRSARTRLEVTGPDRAKFLHNLTTNDVKRLKPSAGHEAFVTSPQGKTLAYVQILATDDALIVRSDPGTAPSFVPHLQKYGVFDQVAIEDRTAETVEYHFTGPGADAALVGLGLVADALLTQPLDHAAVPLESWTIRVVREDPLGLSGWTLIAPVEAADALRTWLDKSGFAAGNEATWEPLRIAAGTPVSGRDVQAGNLPQEVGRDSRAINFVKGCYLGQETVARLDALGHVNKILRGGRVEGSLVVPLDGTPLLADDGKPTGTITSAAFDPDRGTPVFLAYVRVGQAGAGTRLRLGPTSDGTEPEAGAVAVVAELPIPD